MEKRFLDKVEDNTVVRIWSKKTQQEKGDSLTEGYVPELWDFTRISETTFRRKGNSPKSPRQDIEWWASWMIPDEILYRCQKFDWVSLLGIWGTIRYAPLLVLRQYRSRQFILATQGLTQCEFVYKVDNYKKKVREISNA
ncbi:hypothetical protein CXB51_035146 [Gossypium anomalum]|uniref:DUF7745 domain-containing protein n=1 Tax=Gossypium anomalum TaxID=47600 RepID=A0A8J6CK50_9ROSI|nr:hypothetical protein CXB51_035146 [Gossypium anomalum]